MREKRWPTEIFLNWAMPGYFLAQGYKASLKLDYDILCIGKYEPHSSLLREGSPMAFLFTPSGSTEIPQAAKALVQDNLGINCDHPVAINCGVAVIDNRLFEDQRVYPRFATLYGALAAVAPEVPLLEQVALAIVGDQTPGGMSKLDSEPRRVCRRLQLLSRMEHHEQDDEQVFP